MTLAQTFATNLVALRRHASLSQQELALKAHVSVSYVSMLERGQRTAPLSTIEALAKALRTNPIYMLQENEVAPAPRRPRGK